MGRRTDTSAATVARAEKMAGMYRQGVTLKKIGETFGVTRERVRQIIAKMGLTAQDGGKHKVGQSKVEAKKLKRDAICMQKWGVSYDEMKAHRASRLLYAYESQRKNAASRGVSWNIGFSQWLAMWTESGKLHLRGKGTGKYVMSRIKDEGGYVIGNVHIQLATDNNREGLAKCRNNKAANTGVIHLYPGLARGWVAIWGKKRLGFFATEADAVAARAAYEAALPPRKPSRKPFVAQGCQIRRGKTWTRYVVVVKGAYIGCFSTPEAALSARAAAQLSATNPARMPSQPARCHALAASVSPNLISPMGVA